MKTETKRTPGPWQNDDGLVNGVYSDGQLSFDIFDAHDWPGDLEEGKANACLIAASPDLLAAAEIIEYECRLIAKGVRSQVSERGMQLLRAAIAKATR